MQLDREAPEGQVNPDYVEPDSPSFGDFHFAFTIGHRTMPTDALVTTIHSPWRFLAVAVLLPLTVAAHTVGLNKGALVKRFLPRWEIRDGRVELFRPQRIPIIRYRFRGARIPTPWASEAA